MEEKIRVGLVGSGYIADFHARAVQDVEGLELDSVVSPDGNKAEKFAERYHIKNVFTDYDGFIKEHPVDLVILATPNCFHYDQTMKALDENRHVLVEKPMAVRVIEAEEMQTLALSKGLSLMVGQMWRFDREVRWLSGQVQSGRLGRIFKTKGYGIHTNWGPSGWFTQKEKAGGGALPDMGVHAIDTTRLLLGGPEPLRVYAKIGTFMTDYDVDDTGLLIVDWEGGATSVIESGWWQPHMDGPEAGARLYGDQGYGSLFPTFLKKFEAGQNVEETPRFPERIGHCDQHMYTLQMEEMYAAIKEKRQPLPGSAEGIVSLKIIEAAYLSSETGEVISMA
jgi:predicted dehydrogenase